MPLTEPNPLGATDPAGAHRTESTEIAPIYVSLPAIVVLGAEAKQEIHTRVALPASRTAPGPAANFPEHRFRAIRVRAGSMPCRIAAAANSTAGSEMRGLRGF